MWGARDVYNGPLRVSLPELSFRAGHGRAVIRAVSGVASAHGFSARRRARTSRTQGLVRHAKARLAAGGRAHRVEGQAEVAELVRGEGGEEPLAAATRNERARAHGGFQP